MSLRNWKLIQSTQQATYKVVNVIYFLFNAAHYFADHKRHMLKTYYAEITSILEGMFALTVQCDCFI